MFLPALRVQPVRLSNSRPAVSYTHLDVYKRQIGDRLMNYSNLENGSDPENNNKNRVADYNLLQDNDKIILTRKELQDIIESTVKSILREINR